MARVLAGRAPAPYGSDVTGREEVLNHQCLTLQEPEAVAAWTFRRRPALGFSDCLLVELARKAGHVPLGTFDRNLSKVDGAAVPTEPSPESIRQQRCYCRFIVNWPFVIAPPQDCCCDIMPDIMPDIWPP